MVIFRRFLLLVIFAALSAAAFAQPQTNAIDLTNFGVRIMPEKRLITVLASLELAGVNTPLSENGKTFRNKLRADLQNAPADLKEKISAFISQYKKRHGNPDDSKLVTPFISMAYALTEYPELADPIITRDLPGELLDVLDYAPLVREFYRRTDFAARLEGYVKEYRESSDSELRSSTREMVSELLDYLHTQPDLYFKERVKVTTNVTGSKGKKLEKIEIRERERKFFVVPELLAPQDNVSFLNIGDNYYVILPPGKDIRTTDARRAFLQFVFDPLVLRNGRDIAQVRDGIKSLLDQARANNSSITPDPVLAVARSIVAAVDVRQKQFARNNFALKQAREKIDKLQTDAEKKKVADDLAVYKIQLADEAAMELSEAYERGAVLSFYFSEQLRGVEDAGFDIDASIRDMILSFSPQKETNRLAENAEARKRAEKIRAERGSLTTAAVAENPVTKKLSEIEENLTAKKRFRDAANALNLLAKDNASESRIYYALGRVYSLEAENITDVNVRRDILINAKTAYEKTLLSATDRTDKALIQRTYVALARIYEFYEEKAYALKIYEAAVKIGDVPDGVFSEAMVNLQRLYKEVPK